MTDNLKKQLEEAIDHYEWVVRTCEHVKEDPPTHTKIIIKSLRANLDLLSDNPKALEILRGKRTIKEAYEMSLNYECDMSKYPIMATAETEKDRTK